MKPILTFLIFGTVFNCQAQTIQKLNLDFEQNEEGYPAKWDNFGSNDYKIYTDSTAAKSGKFSAVIENDESKSDFKALGIDLPNNYDGAFIRLSGYIKTENVTDGYAGLWMRIDPQIGFDNMNDRGVTGTTDWAAYEITLPLNPKKTDKIVIGGLLVGKGKMWLDNLQVSIDGKDLDNTKLEIYQREIFLAETDIEFNSGSNIVFPDLDDEVITNLNLLGKIWGFLKYHHPEIATGNFNWDYELFRLLPNYLDAKSNQERDKVLTTWIEKYGKLSICEKCKPTSDEAVLKPDLSWIEDSNLLSTLKSSLKEIYNNRNQARNYYIELNPNVGNPEFTNENSYSDMPYPDSGFRLLSLYRYWNMINYFFPYKHLMDKKWNTTLGEYIPQFLNAKNELEYEMAAIQIVGDIQDTHANLWGGADKMDEWKGLNYAPVHLRFIENQLVVTDYYNEELRNEVGLKTGDIITKINGRPIEKMVKEKSKYYPASNMPTKLRNISADLLRSNSTEIEIDFISENAELQTKTLKLYPKDSLDIYRWYRKNNDKSYKKLDNNIGYVTLGSIKNEDIQNIKDEFKNTKGIIIDIRNYPSTFVPFSLGSFFVSSSTPFVKFTNGNVKNPGEFTFTPNIKIPSEGETYKGQLIVLVNEFSQSQAEYTAMAFRAGDNTTIIGSTTAGADGNVSKILLPGGLRSMISGIGVNYPDGGETQRIGIVPDLEVKLTIEGIRAGKDELLEKAIEVIMKE